jgi:hypothetical protein
MRPVWPAQNPNAIDRRSGSGILASVPEGDGPTRSARDASDRLRGEVGRRRDSYLRQSLLDAYDGFVTAGRLWRGETSPRCPLSSTNPTLQGQAVLNSHSGGAEVAPREAPRGDPQPHRLRQSSRTTTLSGYLLASQASP